MYNADDDLNVDPVRVGNEWVWPSGRRAPVISGGAFDDGADDGVPAEGGILDEVLGRGAFAEDAEDPADEPSLGADEGGDDAEDLGDDLDLDDLEDDEDLDAADDPADAAEEDDDDADDTEDDEPRGKLARVRKEAQRYRQQARAAEQSRNEAVVRALGYGDLLGNPKVQELGLDQAIAALTGDNPEQAELARNWLADVHAAVTGGGTDDDFDPSDPEQVAARARAEAQRVLEEERLNAEAARVEQELQATGYWRGEDGELTDHAWKLHRLVEQNGGDVAAAKAAIDAEITEAIDKIGKEAVRAFIAKKREQAKKGVKVTEATSPAAAKTSDPVDFSDDSAVIARGLELIESL